MASKKPTVKKQVETVKAEEKNMAEYESCGYEYCTVRSDDKDSFFETLSIRRKFGWENGSDIEVDDIDNKTYYTVSMRRKLKEVEKPVEEMPATEVEGEENNG